MNQFSSIHLWLTVEPGASMNPHKRLLELSDGSSNYGEIELHVHQGSKGLIQDPADLRHVAWNMTIRWSNRPSAAMDKTLTGTMDRFMFRAWRISGDQHAPLCWTNSLIKPCTVTSLLQPGFVQSSSSPSVCSSVPLVIWSLLSLLQFVCQTSE